MVRSEGMRVVMSVYRVVMSVYRGAHRLSLRFRKVSAKSAAKSMPDPRSIWLTLAVVTSRPTESRMVATRSSAMGIASISVCFSDWGCEARATRMSLSAHKTRPALLQSNR